VPLPRHYNFEPMQPDPKYSITSQAQSQVRCDPHVEILVQSGLTHLTRAESSQIIENTLKTAKKAQAKRPEQK
jgi:hypothetical protein